MWQARSGYHAFDDIIWGEHVRIRAGGMKLAVPSMVGCFQLSGCFHWAIRAYISVYLWSITRQICVLLARWHLCQYTLMEEIFALVM